MVGATGGPRSRSVPGLTGSKTMGTSSKMIGADNCLGHGGGWKKSQLEINGVNESRRYLSAT